MKKFSLLLLLLFVSSYIYANKIIQGRIIKVTDGDTVTLLAKNNKKIKVRLYGIDCPEKKQEFGQTATNYLSSTIYNKNVKIEVKNKDRYQRSVGVIWLDNTNINLSLLKQGLAWHYTQYDKSQSYADAEKAARKAKKNIWSTKNPIAPWDFRKNKTKK
ncbi:thermonuclease family protein [Sphingobacterium rhinopitheci]|uniref:thermonuclease family protein n=1 Tax=Sphingobacterium rhinopitheci TaxID=2781960 RepID=UPI001F517FF9|nr:thermonuclease family protein [Sphingobacterium rhinopitheci]MCI0921341.1 thermonuclease family protein [Sphingobacterium rhinopitheci]